MGKNYCATSAVLLLTAGLALGQTEAARPQPRTTETAAPPVAAVVPADGVYGGPDGVAVPGGSAVWSADADIVLWVFGQPRSALPIASTGALGAAATTPSGGTGTTTPAPMPGTVVGTLVDGHNPGVLIPGGRIALGYWQVDDDPWVPGGVREWGAEAVFLFVPQTSADFANDQAPTLARPFFDLNNRAESALIVASPGVSTGAIAAHDQANFWGAEANAWKNVYCNYPGTTCVINVMGGFRFLSADEQLRIASVSTFNPSIPATSPFAPFAGDRLEVFDSFATHNRFYGGQVGFSTSFWMIEKLRFDLGGKLAFGVTDQELDVAGNQVLTSAAGVRTVSTGGLYALPSNIGHYHRDKFSPIPELNLKVAAPVSDWLTLSVGFTALYWDRFLQASKQIDRELDISQVPNFPAGATATPTGLGKPAVPLVQSDLWLVGLTVGVEITW